VTKPLTAIALGGGITLAALGFVGMFLWVESPSDDELVEQVITLADDLPDNQPRPAEVDPGDYDVRENGLMVYDLEPGTGESPVEGQVVKVHYSGWLADGGKMFDSSLQGGRPPLSFLLGRPGIIEGWQQAVADMKVGGTRQVVIPPDLAYGEKGRPPVIPPNSTLVFDMQLVELGEIRKRPDQPQASFDGADVLDLGDGLEAVQLEEGEGQEAGERSMVTTEFTLWTSGGDLIFSSMDRDRPARMLLGGKRAEKPPIEGMDLGMRGMKPGGVRYLKVPPELAFGERGQPPQIGPNETLYILVAPSEVSAPRTIPENIVEFDRGAMTTTDSGLMYLDVVEGDGEQPSTGDLVYAEYSGWLEDGTLFDSSYKRMAPFSFPLGQGRVIKAWDEAVAGMKVGGKRVIVAPPELAYGDADKGNIPPNSTLVFQIELVDVKSRGPQ